MITSASTSSLSNVEFSPSLSEVVMRVWPCSSIHFLSPSSFSVVPRRLGSCLACSWPYIRRSKPSARPARYMHTRPTSYRTINTLPCKREVAVSDLTPPKLGTPHDVTRRRGAALGADDKNAEDAGRATLEKERINTMVNADWGYQLKLKEMCTTLRVYMCDVTCQLRNC
jgi:hypothetical protein